jgi:hypothetical protein
MDPALYVGRGQEFLTAGKVEAAIVEFNHAIVEHPDYLVAHVARLRAYVLEKDLPRAETALAEMPAGLDQNTLTALHSEVERLKPKDDLRPITPGIHVHYSRHEDGATVSFVSRSFGADLRDVTLQPDIDCAEVSFYYVEDRPAARLVSDQIERELSRAGLTFKVPPAPTTLRVLPDEVQGRPRGAIEVRLPSLSSARPCSMLHAERTGN